MNKTTLFCIGRWLAVLAAIVFLVSYFSTGSISKTPISELETLVTSKMEEVALEKSDASVLHRDYGLAAGDYEDFVLYSPVSFMDAQELLIVKLADTAQAQAVQSAMEKRLQERTSVFDSGYGPTQYTLLTKNAKIFAEGNYVLFVASENADAIVKAFSDAL